MFCLNFRNILINSFRDATILHFGEVMQIAKAISKNFLHKKPFSSSNRLGIGNEAPVMKFPIANLKSSGIGKGRKMERETKRCRKSFNLRGQASIKPAFLTSLRPSIYYLQAFKRKPWNFHIEPGNHYRPLSPRNIPLFITFSREE